MNKERANEILKEISSECQSHKNKGCYACKFFIGHSFNSYCLFDAVDNENNYDGAPRNWIIQALPNL